MRIKNIFLGFQLLFLAGTLHVAAQQTADVKSNLEKFTKNYIQEKIYLQTDKEYYQAGEIIWFNAYTLDVQTHRLLDFSKVLYVDVINDSNHQVITAKITVDSAIGNGSLFIPLSVNSGNYKLRAYTSWMKNFSASGFFEKYITIVNPQKPNPTTQNNADISKPTLTIQLFPEGGNLVKNVKTKIAYLAETNTSVDFGAISAFIISNNKDTVQNINLDKSGMGHFYFTPLSDEPYTIQYHSAPNVKITGDFPSVKSMGYSLNIQEDDKNVWVNILGSSANQSLQLVVHTRGAINYFEQVNLLNGTAKININKAQLPAGIAHFTLFTNNGKPLAERLFFTPPKDSLTLSVSTNKTTYQNREAVDISIAAHQANVTLSVFQIDSLQGLPQTTIQKYLYFLSELKNAIPKSIPIPSINKTETALDDILLTYGWRRFNWDEMQQEPSFTYPPEISAHLISGNVQNASAKNANELVRLKIGAPSITAAFNNAEIPFNSTFHLPFKNLFGSNFLVINTEDDIKQYKININNPFSNQFTKFGDWKFSYPSNNANTLLNQYVQMQVQNIYNHEQLNQFTTASYMDTTAFYYNPTSSYLLDQYTRFTTIEEILREYVPLVDVRKSNGKLVAKIFDAELKRHLMGEILFLLDGVAIDNVKDFFNYDPLKLKQLDVIPTYYLLGKSVYSGIISWKSNHPDINNYQGLINNSVTLDYEGLQLARLFYTPSYETQELKNSKLPDYRNVLYWQPSIKFTDNATHHQKFYTSDIAGKYVIVAEGINQNGNGGTSFTFFTVQ